MILYKKVNDLICFFFFFEKIKCIVCEMWGNVLYVNKQGLGNRLFLGNCRG